MLWMAQDLCKAAGIPTGAYEVFTDPGAAKAYIRSRGAPIVVKADGLAAGKGVVVAASVAEAEAAVDDMLVARRFGDAGPHAEPPAAVQRHLQRMSRRRFSQDRQAVDGFVQHQTRMLAPRHAVCLHCRYDSAKQA